MIPAVTEINGWTRLRRLRECLQRQGRLREACVILDPELARTPDGSEQEKACKSLLEACLSQKNSPQPIWWITGWSKLRLGELLTAGSQVQASDDAFQDARRAFEAAQAPGYENNALLPVRLAELKALTRFGHQDTFQAWEEFVQCANVKKDNWFHRNALWEACQIALVHLESKNSPSNLKTFWQWYGKAESISEELGDIAFLSIFRLATGNVACTIEENFGAILKWQEDLEMKHPSFHLWRQKIIARRTISVIYQMLNDSDNVNRIISEMQYFAADQDDFWSEDGFRKQADIKVSSKNRKPDITSAPAAFQGDDSEMELRTEWSDILSDSRHIDGSSSIFEVKLCSWIKEEFQAGVLTKQDLTEILFSDPFSDADMSQVNKSLDEHHINQDELKEYVWDAIIPEAGNLENNSDSILEDRVTSLTPETVSYRLFGTGNAPSSKSRWEKAYSTLSDWLLSKSARSKAWQHFLLFQAQNQRLNSVISSASSNEICALEAQRLIALFPKLDAKVQEIVSPTLSNWRSIVALAKHHGLFLAMRSDILLNMHSPELKEIIELYNQALEDNRDRKGLLVNDIRTNMDLARVYFFPAVFKLDPIATEGLFNVAVRAVQAFEKLRAGWRALTGWDRVEKLILALGEKSILLIAPTVVTVTCNVVNNKREERDKQIWDMIQFAKSIGISWLMESNAADAREKATEGKNNSDQIHFEAVGSQSDPKKASDSKGNLRTQPNTSKDSKEDPTTGKRQVNEKAAAVDTVQLLADLQNINHLGGDAIFVDWYNSACGLVETPQPVVATLSGTNEQPRCFLASITWKQVDEVVDEFIDLDSEDLIEDGRTEILYKLNPLVEPLAWTKPGQTLVFSPCGNLHRIPLHALKIDGEVIIKRNPVVYCSSLSALVSTYRLQVPMEPHSSTLSTADVSNTETPALSPRVDPDLKVLLYGDPPTPNGQAALEATATKFKAKAHTGESFTASSFTSAIQDPGLHLLHYHGHVDFSPTDPTDHCLLFSDRDRLTLRDVFDLPSPLSHGGGFHVTLLGCGSGMSKTVATDDVIGLVPSLLYAGASSTVSTLWKLADIDAAAYSGSFYEGFFSGGTNAGEDMAEAIPSAGDVVVDLAKANQTAILRIMQSRPALYHWASFVLNGYWMMRSPLGK